jgi:hypothetical protein
MKWDGSKTHNLVYGKHEAKRMVRKPPSYWIDNIKTDLQEVGCNEMDWINLD